MSDITNKTQEQMAASGEEPLFSMGKDTKADADKKTKKKPEQVAEERLKETFNLGGVAGGDDLKRKREDFAV
jgi:hypothetical protein